MEVRDKVLKRWALLLNISDKDLPALKETLSHYTDLEVVRPFVIRDLQKGVGRDIIIARYGLTAGEMRGIGIKAGIYKPKRF